MRFCRHMVWIILILIRDGRREANTQVGWMVWFVCHLPFAVLDFLLRSLICI